MFKKKAMELATKLQRRFPSQLLFVSPAIQNLDADELLDNYVRDVHSRYTNHIKAKDETFFLTTSDIDDPLNMVSMLRGLWVQMCESDKDVVWRYMELFEKLALKSSKEPTR